MRQYLELSRSPWYSFLVALPLLLLYQLAALLGNVGQRARVINGADAVIQNGLQAVGLHGWLGSWLAVALVAGIVVYRKDRAHSRQALRPPVFAAMLAESVLYAVLLGTVVSFLTALFFPGAAYLQIGGGQLNWGQKLAASLGAGLYEELLFRVLITGGLLWGLARCGMARGAAAVTAVVLSSFIFSLFHYIGPFAEAFRLGSFTYRLVAGVVLAGLYTGRGFGVAAWTHALYDVFLLAAGHG